MTDDDDLFRPLTPPMSTAKPRPHRHRWVAYPYAHSPLFDNTDVDPPTEWCDACHRWRDKPTTRRNRNNRSRGGRAELDVARLLGGRKVGTLGHPWDVEQAGYARWQVKKLAKWPSLEKVVAMLDAIPVGPEMRGVVLIEAAGQGKRGRALVIVPLDEFAERHGR